MFGLNKKKKAEEEENKNQNLSEDKLAELLEISRRKLKEQDELLQQLTTPHFGYATVLGVNDVNKNPKPTDFTRGTRVKIKPSSKFAHQNPGAGTILGPQTFGWVRVAFDDSPREVFAFRTGERKKNDAELQGECDLDILDMSSEAIINYNNQEIGVLIPKNINIVPGNLVKISSKTFQIIEVEKRLLQIGRKAKVLEVIDKSRCEVETHGETRVVANNRLLKIPETGDNVVLDPSSSIIIANLGKNDERFNFTDDTHVSWDDIGGLEATKTKIQELLLYSYRYSELYTYYGKKQTKGIMLYGPPGCGKTMLGKAVATSLAEISKSKKTSSGFIYIKGPEILNKYVGESEATIRSIFAAAREHKKKHHYPAIIFIDEADAIMYKRGEGVSSDVDRTIVPAFLAEMDGLEESAGIVILATNRPDVLDPAIVRAGRIDEKIKVTRPQYKDAVNIFSLYLKKVACLDKSQVKDLALASADRLFDKTRVLYRIDLNGDHVGQHLDFTLGELCNGAMISNIIDKSTSQAILRDIKNNSKTSITQDDINISIDEVFKENFDMNHSDDIKEFVGDLHKDMIRVRPIKKLITKGE